MAKITVGATPIPSYNPYNQIRFDNDPLSEELWDKGYGVIHEKAVKCPCKSANGADNKSNCLNCGGAGWLFVNPNKTKMVIERQSKNEKYKEYSSNMIGMASVSALAREDLGIMDRLTLLSGKSQYTETVFADFFVDGKKTGRLVYKPIDVFCVFVFVGESNNLRLLDESEYSIVGNLIKIDNNEVNNISNLTLSIRYSHRPVYHIIEENRSTMVQRDSRDKEVSLPTNHSARLAHYVYDSMNYEYDSQTKTGLLDNSFTEKKC